MKNSTYYKRFSTLLVIIFMILTILPSFSQNLKPIAELVAANQVEKTGQKVSLFTVKQIPLQNLQDKKQIVKEATFATPDATKLKKLYQNHPKTMTFALPFKGQIVDLDVVEVDILTEDFKVNTSKGEKLVYAKGRFYQGIIKGDNTSSVALSVFQDEIIGMASSDKMGNLSIGRLPNTLSTDHVIYSDRDLLVESDFTCNVAIPTKKPKLETREIQAAQLNANNCVRVYFECTFAYYQAKGSNITNVTNHLTAIFNNVALLYKNENINTTISQIFVWTSPDGYSTTNARTSLDQFGAKRPTFDGDLAHLVDLSPSGGAGGIAWLDVLCVNGFKYAYSQIFDNFSNFPMFSWNVEVLTHEMGHNLGSPHTHSCSWPGGPIDNCYKVEDGTCSPGPTPTNGGTIMSYCHLSAIGINFNNGFGLLPGNLIRDNVYNAPCLGTNCASTLTCAAPSTPSVSNIANTGATVTWTAVSGAKDYKVEYKRASDVNWLSQTSATTTATLTGLVVGTNYLVRITTNCTNGKSSDPSTAQSFTTTIPCSSAPSYAFTFNGKNYAIVKAKKTWADAAACAVEQGGYLAHIETKEEQDAIYQAILAAGVLPSYTVVEDGGGIAYVWIGATDKFTEGKWLWAGNNTNTNINFWNGKGAAGSAANGRYHRWGNSTTGGQRIEPDDFENNQDAAAIALAKWPSCVGCPTYGVASEWNDIDINNELYFVIEKGAIPCSLIATTPTLSNTTSTATKLTWTAVVGAKYYTPQYKKSSDATWISLPTTIALTIDLTGLTGNTDYVVRILANCSNGEPGTPSVEKVFITLPPCSPPATTLSNISYTSARINWSALTGISGYEVRYKVKGAANWLAPTKTAVATATFVDLTSLALGTTYEYQIRLKCTTTNFSEYSSTREFTTQTCTAPAAPTISQLTLTSARIDWEGVVGSLGYELRYRAKGATTWTPKTATATTTFINLTNLLPGTTYEYELRLKCTSTGFSAFSITKEFMTVSCGVPNPIASDMTLSTVRISWTAIGGGLGYELRYRIKGVATWTNRTATAATEFLSLTNLLPGTTYEYELRLKCTTTGFSAYSTTKEFMTVSCGVPAPVASDVTLSTVRISWSAFNGGLGYELRYRVKGATTWLLKTATATITFLNLTNLQPGTTYEYEMRLKCTSNGFSIYSATQEFMTNPCGIPTPSVLQTSYATARIGWTAIGGALGYELRYRVKGVTTWTPKTATATATFIDLTALKINTMYEYEMRLKCTTTGFSAYTATQEFSTNSCMPVTPSVKSMTTISITVEWTPQTGVSGYEVSYRKKGVTTWTPKSITGAATNTTTLTALIKSTTYEIRMLTKCLATSGSSDYSDIIEATTPAQLGAEESALEMPNAGVNNIYKENRLTISPNPTNGVVTLQIHSAEKGIGQIVVSDNVGRVVLKVKDVPLEEGVQMQEVNLSGLSNGVYIIQIRKGGWQEIKKILLQK